MTPAIFFFLEGHSADFECGFFNSLKRNEPTAETQYHDSGIRHLRFILTHNPPIVSRRIRPNE